MSGRPTVERYALKRVFAAGSAAWDLGPPATAPPLLLYAATGGAGGGNVRRRHGDTMIS